MSKVLIAAIEANDPDAVRKALKGIKDINRKLPGADKPLLYAAKKGADKVLAPLFEAGAIAEKRHTFPGDTPFAIAAKHHQGKVLEQLLALKQASGEAIDHAVNNAMMDNDPKALEIVLRATKRKINLGDFRLASAQHRGIELLKILLQNGGDPQARFDVHRTTAVTVFHEIVGRGNPEIVKLLIAHGADINSRDGSGCTPLMVLAYKLETLEFSKQRESLLQKLRGMENVQVLSSGSPAVYDPIAVLETLVQAGADVTLMDDSGNDCLDYYLFEYKRSGRKEPDAKVVDFLTRAGAKGSQATHELFDALRAKNPDSLRRAIAKGADVNRLTPPLAPRTPLTWAANDRASDAFTIVTILLDAGADPNKLDESYTPLIYAARSGNLEVVKALITAGANLHHVCDDGDIIENAYSAAEGKDEIRAYLKSLGAQNPKRANAEGLKPGVASWNDFSDLLVKTTVPQAAEALAKIIHGKISPEVYEKPVTPGKHSFVVLRPKGMHWCNILRITPPLMRFENQEKFAGELAKATGAPALFIEYSDTSDAASIFQIGPDGKSTRDNGWDNDILGEMADAMGDKTPDWAKKQLASADDDDLNSTERLQQLAEREKFVVAAFGFGHEQGQKLDIEFTGLGPEHFDGVAFVSD